MAESTAERQRRHRRHVKGDHSLCMPGRCDRADDAPQPITVRDNGTEGDAAQPVIEPRTERGPRGRQLWDDLSPTLPAAAKLMLDEACRIADRLDRLDAMLEGRDAWADVSTDDGGEIRLVIDGLLAETRQQATALRGLLVEVTKAAPKATSKPAAPSGPSATAGGISSLADAAARRRRSTA